MKPSSNSVLNNVLNKLRTKTLCASALLCATLTGHASVILDNTINGTNSITTNLGSISLTSYQAKIITTPGTGSWSLYAKKMALYESGGSVSRLVTVDLMAVDGSNNPTGTVLATQSFTVNLTATPTYYDFDLNQNIWGLNAATTYAFVFRSDASSATTSWTQPSNNNTYSTSLGFTFVESRRSLDAGSTWFANGYNNGLQLSVISTSTAVPEPTATGPAVGFALLLCAAAAVSRRRVEGAVGTGK
jgi:hypothetical protein